MGPQREAVGLRLAGGSGHAAVERGQRAMSPHSSRQRGRSGTPQANNYALHNELKIQRLAGQISRTKNRGFSEEL